MTTPCTANDIRLVAEALARGTCEAEWRTAANRAYYAAYHHAHGVASLVPGDDTNCGPKGGLGHRELARRLRNWRMLPIQYARLRRFEKQARAAGQQLASAIAARELADYSLGDDFPSGEAELQMLRMQSVFDFVDEVLPELERLCA